MALVVSAGTETLHAASFADSDAVQDLIVATTMRVAKVVAVANETFVFNDKFSFNGFGAAAYTEPMNTAAEQVLIAAQGGTLQRYQYQAQDADVDCDIHVTYIDQNNA